MEVWQSWSNAVVLKTTVLRGTIGSNPIASALIQKETPIKLGEVTVGNQCVVTYLSVSLIKAKH